MREPLEENFRTVIVQERRRLYAILLSTGVFTLMMPFTRQTDHFLAIGLGCISFLFALVFVPGRWFYQGRLQLTSDRPRPHSQPPAEPSQPLTCWPPREGPLPPLPSRPRRR